MLKLSPNPVLILVQWFEPLQKKNDHNQQQSWRNKTVCLGFLFFFFVNINCQWIAIKPLLHAPSHNAFAFRALHLLGNSPIVTLLHTYSPGATFLLTCGRLKKKKTWTWRASLIETCVRSINHWNAAFHRDSPSHPKFMMIARWKSARNNTGRDFPFQSITSLIR